MRKKSDRIPVKEFRAGVQKAVLKPVRYEGRQAVPSACFPMNMKIVLASDTHGKNDRLEILEKSYPDALLFLHAGDFGRDPEIFDHWIKVAGNNDIYYPNDLDSVREVIAQNHRILLMHSHQYPVALRKKKMAALAREKDCDIVVFGHSHVPSICEEDGILMINPGSLSRNRDGSLPSYAVLDLSGSKPQAQIMRYDDLPAGWK